MAHANTHRISVWYIYVDVYGKCIVEYTTIALILSDMNRMIWISTRHFLFLMADSIFNLASPQSGKRPVTSTKHYQNRRHATKNQHPSSILSTGFCVEMNQKILSLFLKKYLWLSPEGWRQIFETRELGSGSKWWRTLCHTTRIIGMGSDGFRRMDV